MTLLTEGKSTLYFRPKLGDTLENSGQNFTIKNEAGETVKKIPAISARDILIFGDSSISAKVFTTARKNAVPIHFLDGNGKFQGSAVFDFEKNVFLRAEQFRTHENEKKRLEIAKKFVMAKCRNQKVFLQKMRISSVDFFDSEKICVAENLEILRGIEGAAAKKYFEFWKTGVLKNSDFRFSGRWKRPPLDPVNAFLSFSYSLLHAEILTQLLIAGMDPYFGFLHDQKYGHAALASDFLEIFRGPADHFVAKSLNLREFLPEDFAEETGGIWKFSTAGFQKFFPKWAAFLRYEKFLGEKSLVAVIERDVRKMTHFFMGDEPDFIPFQWQK